MFRRLDRRQLLGGMGAVTLAPAGQTVTGQTTYRFQLPISNDGGLPGDGFWIRHGFQTENTWYYPGAWHTGEDWYRLDGVDTAGAAVHATGDGTVVFLGSNYPGRVVIIQHSAALFSMYGHLAFDTIAVATGDHVRRGQQIGTVLQRTDGVPSHLHFEIRTFLYESAVNGNAPRYGFDCGYQCAPGPGYWPMDAPELPVGMGWRNPTHVIGNRLLLDGPLTMQVASGAPPAATLTPGSSAASQRAEPREIALELGQRFDVLAIDAGAEASTGVSADAYRLSIFVDDGAGVSGWLAAVVADYADTGSDGRPSSVRFILLPAVS